MMRWVVVVMLMVPLVAHAEDEQPPLSAGRLVGEVVVGGLAGIGGAFLGGVIGDSTCDHTSEDEDCIGPVILGLYLGGVLGMTAGVYAAGSFGDEHGSLGATLGGAALGTLVGVGGAAIAREDTAGGIMLLACPVAGALLGFNLSRGYDRGAVTVVPTSSGAAVMFSRAW